VCVRPSRGYLPLSDANHVPHSLRASSGSGKSSPAPAVSAEKSSVVVSAESKPAASAAALLERYSDVDTSRVTVTARRPLHEPVVLSHHRPVDPTYLPGSAHVDLTSPLGDSRRYTSKAGFQSFSTSLYCYTCVCHSCSVA